MASHPPASCCTVGVKHEGEPTGKSVKIDDKWDSYLAVPAADKEHKDAAILFLPDVYGIWQNSKLIADQFAANGYRTLIADVVNGDPAPLNKPADFDINKWRSTHGTEVVDPIVEAAIEYLKAQGVKKIGAVGYCFGAKFVVRHYKTGIDVGYVAHPSFVTEEELSAVTGPFSIAAAETDAIFPADKRHKSEEILKGLGKPYQINLYSGVSHGFAVRGDLAVRANVWAKEQAFLQAVHWFDEFLLLCKTPE